MTPSSPRAFALLFSCALAACSQPDASPSDPPVATEAPPPSAPPAEVEASPPTVEIARALPADLPGSTEGCPAGMVRVEGEYCPAVMQDCLEHHKEYRDDPNNKNVSERCLRYAVPSRCVSKRRVHLAFCIDRFEYPNEPFALPRVLTSWTQAKAQCESIGKRLCSEPEMNFACEGPDMLPYSYGYVRNDEVCNIDRPYRYPDHSRVLPTYDECLLTPWCKAELERLDQRLPIGESLTCTSWAGAFDLNGNVNEWVTRPGEKAPNRSGLKGGWWGPVRSRCRPTVTFHKESDYGYEVGFRCCGDVAKE